MSFCNGCGDGEVGGCKTIPPVAARILSGDGTSPLTRDASLVRSKVLLSFCNGCGDGEGRCNGRGKPTPLRKASGIVRFWKGWCGAKGGASLVRGKG